MPRRTRFGDVWPFGKPKTPGFGISKSFYLSVMATKAALPSPAEVARPGDDSPLEGFFVPIDGKTDRERLTQPIERGVYAASSIDQKTVLRVVVVPKEVGMPGWEKMADDWEARGCHEVAQNIRSCWTLIQLSFEAHDPMVASSLKFLRALAARVARLTDGLIADPLAAVFAKPEEYEEPNPAQFPIWAPQHVHVHSREVQGELHVYTKGLQKFALSEFEAYGVALEHLPKMTAILLALAQEALLGRKFEIGDKVRMGSTFDLAVGGLDAALWEGVSCLELLPESGSNWESSLSSANI